MPSFASEAPSFDCRDPTSDVKMFEEQGGNVIVGTPGRLLDVIKRSQSMNFKNLEMLILDEADRLLLGRSLPTCWI